MVTKAWLWGATVLCVLLQPASVHVPFLRDVLRTVRLTAADRAVVAVGSLAPVAVEEMVKGVQRWRGRSG